MTNETTTPETAPEQAGSDSKRLVMRLRSRCGITEDMATDDEVLAMTNGSLSRALEDLSMAADDFGGAVKDAVSADIRDARCRIHSAQAKFLQMFRGA